jgi:hypothetical protein
MTKIHLGAAILFSTLFILAITANAAYAITGNYQPDTTRTNVGIVVFYTIDPNGNRIPIEACTGVLISPRIVLTSAHACVTQTAVVCFDSGPFTWTIQDNQIILNGVTSTYDGTACPNPDYATNIGGKNGAPYFSYRDVALIVLKEPVPASIVSKYGQLPNAGLVDTLPVKTDVTLVGYGMQEQLTPRNSQKNTWTGLIMRNSAQAKLGSGNFAWSDEFIRCSANPGQGKGGIAYGDSGGPVFLGQTNTILALNSYVTNRNCVGETYHSRIDIPKVLTWIKQGVSVYG